MDLSLKYHTLHFPNYLHIVFQLSSSNSVKSIRHVTNKSVLQVTFLTQGQIIGQHKSSYLPPELVSATCVVLYQSEISKYKIKRSTVDQ